MSRVYFSPEYGFPGSNVVLDNLSKPFDPFEGPITTLSEISDKFSTGNDIAFKGIIRSLSRYPQVRNYVLESAKLAAQAANKPTKRGPKAGNRPNRSIADSPKLVAEVVTVQS